MEFTLAACLWSNRASGPGVGEGEHIARLPSRAAARPSGLGHGRLNEIPIAERRAVGDGDREPPVWASVRRLAAQPVHSTRINVASAFFRRKGGFHFRQDLTDQPCGTDPPSLAAWRAAASIAALLVRSGLSRSISTSSSKEIRIGEVFTGRKNILRLVQTERSLQPGGVTMLRSAVPVDRHRARRAAVARYHVLT